ncbi:MAG: glycosyltransferase family 39 protein, partial [Spirochaetes bacterium]|nr:glycosyltransferase family 39 protein [Spirochaetota bacterium]
ISFNLLILLFITGFMIIILNLKNYKNILSYISNIKIPKIEIKRINLVWLFFFLIISFLLFGSIAKSLYWPTAAYDNVAGYDLMAKVMANEGEIKNSLFEINDAPILGSAKRIIYPPLVAGSFAIAYLNDLSTSKLMSSLFFLTFVIVFYALLKKYTGPTSSILFTFFLVITPEMFAFTSLSTTNIPTAVYASLAIIYLFVWLDKNEKQYLIISAILMALASWCRSDSIIFSFAGLTIIFFKIIKSKNWSNLVVFSLISFSLIYLFFGTIPFIINSSGNVYCVFIFLCI